MHGIIIAIDASGRPLTLISRGELWEHARGDVMFAVPDFANKDTVARCGTEETARNESEVNARIELLRQIRALEKTLEVESQKIGSALEHALVKARIYARDPDSWLKITTTEAARLITTKRTIPTVTLLCVHKCLMGKPKTFIADQRDYLATQTFTIRPLREIQEMEAVALRIHRKDESVLAFVEKARNLIAASRNKPPSTEDPPTVELNETCSFTEEDLGFIRFLLQSLRTTRTIQRDPMFVPTCTLVKMINMYDEHVDTAVIHKLLVDMDVLPPWDDPVVRDASTLMNATFVERREPSTVPSPPPSPLGREEFYPRDIVEHIRYDFGDMAVYVIDDPGAQELDDGISVEPVPGEAGSVWMHVHIADPTSLIHPDHVYAENARKEGTTLYFVPESFPLLPRDVVHNGLSLGSDPNGSKVMTFSVKVDSAGDISDYLVRPGVVRNIRVVHYDSVNVALGVTEGQTQYPFGRTGPPTPPLEYTTSDLENLKKLQKVTDRLAKRRFDSDVLQFNTSQLNMKLLSQPPSTEVIAPGPRTFNGFPALEYSVLPANNCDYGSRRIVGEAMKAACRVASRFFRDRNLSAIRRSAGALVTQSDKDMGRLLAKRDENGCISYADVIRLGAKVPAGENTLLPKGHWQLGVPDGEGYVRVTSPLRRYTDMVAHWQIKHALLSTTTGQHPWMFTDIWLNDLAKAAELNEAYIRVVERRDHKYWGLKFIQNQKPSPAMDELLSSLHAIVVEEVYRDCYKNKNRSRVYLPQLGMQGYLFTPLDFTSEVAQTLPVAIQNIVLGINPELHLVVRK